MRVEVITLHRVHNFGSALQTFATQQVLRSAGFAPEILDYRRPSESPVIRDQIRYNFRRWDRNAATRAAFRALRGRQLQRQESHFDDFLRRRVTMSAHTYLSADELKEDAPAADIFCVGSDQVWNDHYHVPGSEGPFYLDFAPRGARKFSLASSFGRGQLDANHAARVRDALGDFNAVSVREASGVEILRDLGISATHLVDPTLSQPAAVWRALEEQPSESEDYILVYQLHRDHDLSAAVAAARRENRINRVVTVRGFWTPAGARVRSLHDTTIEQFVGLVSHARHVVTDSFHGTAFSLNLGRQFTAVLPSRYSERITSLLELMGTPERVWQGDQSGAPTGELDWADIDVRLTRERSRFASFLGPLGTN